MNDQDVEIKAAIDGFDIERARALIRNALRDSPTAETYYLAAQVALNNDQKRDFLTRAVALDPFHAAAFAELGSLDSGAHKEVQSQPAPTAPIIQDPVVEPTPVIIPSNPPPKTGGGSALFIFLGVVIFFVLLVIYMSGFFGGKSAFVGTWNGTFTGGTMTCTDGSSAKTKDTYSSISIAARSDNAIEWYAQGNKCMVVMNVNGTTAKQRNVCVYDSGNSKRSIEQALFGVSGNTLSAALIINTESQNVTCISSFNGFLTKEH